MTKIMRVSGVGYVGKPLVTTPYELDPYASDAVTDLLLTRERMELEKQILADPAVAGIGNAAQVAESYDYNLALLNKALELAESGRGGDIEALGGEIVSVSGAYVGKTKLGKFLQKVGNGIKKVAKTAVKVVTAPVRLVAKGILEVAMPAAGPGFLYVFLTDQQAAKAPAGVQRKRNKQMKFVRFVTNVIGMKEERIRTIFRNGIMKRMNDTPERILARKLGVAVSGPNVGALPMIGPVVIALVQKIISAFKRKPARDEEMTEGDVPSEDDWAGYGADAEEQAPPPPKPIKVPPVTVRNKKKLKSGLLPQSLTSTQAGTRTTRVTARLPGQNTLTSLAPQGAENIVPTGGDTADQGGEKKSNMLPILIGAGALMFFMSKKK